MTSFEAKQLAEKAAKQALDSAEGDWFSAQRIMVRWAERDPLLREAIRIYVEDRGLEESGSPK